MATKPELATTITNPSIHTNSHKDWLIVTRRRKNRSPTNESQGEGSQIETKHQKVRTLWDTILTHCQRQSLYTINHEQSRSAPTKETCKALGSGDNLAPLNTHVQLDQHARKSGKKHVGIEPKS